MSKKLGASTGRSAVLLLGIAVLVALLGGVVYGVLEETGAIDSISSMMASTSSSSTPTDRDRAVEFYKGADYIFEDISEVRDNWNGFLLSMDYTTTLTDISLMAWACQITLQTEYDYLLTLYAPQPLSGLKNAMSGCISTGIDAFRLTRECLETPNVDCPIDSDQKMAEFNASILQVADEWLDGLNYYNIKLSEIAP